MRYSAVAAQFSEENPVQRLQREFGGRKFAIIKFQKL